MGEQKKPWEERFWSRVDKATRSGCWVWMGGRTVRGYGKMSINDVEVYAHRLSWELHHGVSPGDSHVCHHCDNPPCVNPEHLFLGDARSNALDKESKGRGNHPPMLGARNGSAKIAPADVHAALSMRVSGLSNKEIARRFGVNPSTIDRVMRGKTSVSAAALRKARGE